MVIDQVAAENHEARAVADALAHPEAQERLRIGIDWGKSIEVAMRHFGEAATASMDASNRLALEAAQILKGR